MIFSTGLGIFGLFFSWDCATMSENFRWFRRQSACQAAAVEKGPHQIQKECARMKHSNWQRVLALVGCLVLAAALALSFAGCAGKEPAAEGKSFQVVVTDLDGKQTTFDYTSDKAMLGDALVAEGLVEGEIGEYGLYITSVNGISLDWEKDGKYWAFYIDGQYASTGVDSTEITEGAVYSFKPE